MRDLVSSLFSAGRSRGVALAGGGMVTLCLGGKATALALFGKGVMEIEKAWRTAHPEFSGGLKQRWDQAVAFYEATHRDPTNRALHIAGIPLILSGAIGLIVWPRYTAPWWLANGSFLLGWAMNLVGHAFFEKNRPAFADDPLSFVAGPVWDARQWYRLLFAGGRDDREVVS